MTSSSSTSFSSSSTPTIRFQASQYNPSSREELMCGICQHKIIKDAHILSCSSRKIPHIFHEMCLVPWNVRGGKDTCPSCRTVTKPTPFYEIVRAFVRNESSDKILVLLDKFKNALLSSEYMGLLDQAVSKGYLEVIKKILTSHGGLKDCDAFPLLIEKARRLRHDNIVQYLLPFSAQHEEKKDLLLMRAKFSDLLLDESGDCLERIVDLLEHRDNILAPEDYLAFLRVAAQMDHRSMAEAMLFILPPNEEDSEVLMDAAENDSLSIVKLLLKERKFSPETLKKAREKTANPDIIDALRLMDRWSCKPIVLIALGGLALANLYAYFTDNRSI